MGNNIGLRVGTMPPGARNLITDVPGVLVGHKTLRHGDVNTGVTAVLPHGGNIFRSKVAAATHVINGFGKSAGLMQIDEMGTIETPIILTNTLAVGTGINAVVRYMMADNPEIGTKAGTVNAVVAECNDGYLNDIRDMHVTEQDVLDAIRSAGEVFEEGAVGGGTGMSCYGLKGGIGSASRQMEIGGRQYTLGALLMTNMGITPDLTVCGSPIGQRIAEASKEPDKGSVIVLLATDLPLTCRQMGRVARRAQNGLAHTGTITGNGSGDLVIMFSTANAVPHWNDQPVLHFEALQEDHIDQAFRAAAECVEESVLSSLLHAQTMVGRKGHTRKSLMEYSALLQSACCTQRE